MLQIGSNVWLFELYRGARIATRNDWKELKVLKETARSWIVTCNSVDIKIPKNHNNPMYSPTYTVYPNALLALTSEALDEYVWGEQHRYKLTEAIRTLDVPTLRKVATLIGYSEDK